VLQNLWEWAKKLLTPEELSNMFVDKEGYERTAWYMAAEKDQTVILQNLSEWPKEVLTPEELNNLFLAKDGVKQNVLNLR
jgi:predicted flavoprotein YhiN